MPRPAVLVLTPSADGYGSDGAMADVALALSERAEVTVLAADGGPTLERLRAAGIRVVDGPDWALRRRSVRPSALPGSVLRVAASVRLIRRLHRRHRFDSVYANTVASMLLPVLRPALPRRVRVVVHVREIPRTGAAFSRVFFRRLATVADAVIVNSSATSAAVTGAAPRIAGRTRIVHDGVSPRPASPGPASPGPASPGPAAGSTPTGARASFVITCVARIHPQKGHAVVIDALARASAAGRDWVVEVWGDALPEHAELAAALRRQAEVAGVADRVHWHGYERDPDRLYGTADAAVVASTWPEGFSLVTAEAQLAGLPVVASVPGGPADIVVDEVTGRLVPAGDAAALAAALAALDDDRATARAMGAAGRERILARFTTERSAAQVVACVLGRSDGD